MKKGGKGHSKYDKIKEEKEKEDMWQNRYAQKMRNAAAGFSTGLRVFFGILIVLIILTVLFFIGYGLYRLGKLIYTNYQTRSAEGLTLMDWITNPLQASEEMAEYGVSFFSSL